MMKQLTLSQYVLITLISFNISYYFLNVRTVQDSLSHVGGECIESNGKTTTIPTTTTVVHHQDCPVCSLNTIDIHEKEEKQIYDKFIAEHPLFLSREYAYDESIGSPLKLSQRSLGVRYELLECLLQSATTDITIFETKFGSDWWSSSKSWCGKSQYLPIRRELILAKVLHCLGKRGDMKKVVDPFLMFGSAAYLVANSMFKSNRLSHRVFGFESDKDRFQFASLALQGLPTVLNNTITVVPGQKYTTPEKTQDLEGPLVDFCKQNRDTDMVWLDGTGTVFKDATGQERKGLEYFVVRDICRPRFIVVMHLQQPQVQFFISETNKLGTYDTILTATTKGYGCLPGDKRQFSVLYKNKG